VYLADVFFLPNTIINLEANSQTFFALQATKHCFAFHCSSQFNIDFYFNFFSFNSMFSKVVIASSLTLAAAGTSAVTKSGVQPAQNKKSTATTVASSGVTSSAAITTGAWAEESHTSCSSLDSEPWEEEDTTQLELSVQDE
jgi:hypothetical protein